MAYDKVFLAAQEIMSKRFSEPEMRAALRPVNTVMLKNKEGLFINLKNIVDSEGVQTKVIYFTRNTDTVTHARTSDHAGGVGADAEYTLSFTPYVRNFSYSLKDSKHLVLGSEILATDMFNAIVDLNIDIETDGLAFLESQKSGVNIYNGHYGNFDEANDIFNILHTDKDRFYAIVNRVMKSNKYNRNLDLIYSADGEILFNEQAAQVKNNKNLSYQLAGVDFSGVTDGITPDADEFLQMYAWEKGAVAMVDRVPLVNSLGINTKVCDYWTIPCFLGSGMTYAIHSYEKMSDAGNYTQDVRKFYQVSVDIARGRAPLSVSNETVIQKFALLKENI